MSKFISVLMVTPEVYPFLKTSELADLCYAHALGSREVGHDLRIMAPKYGFISERKNRIHDINRLKDLPITIGSKTSLATVKSSSINNPRVKVQAYITTNSDLLDANKGVLVDNTTGKAFSNNDERFIFFNRTVVETCLLLGWFPDVIQCVGWQTALLPAYLRTMYAEEFKNTRIIQTIVNFEEQGAFGLKAITKSGLPDKAVKILKYKEKANFLRAGIAFADAVTTLSPEYAAEVSATKEWQSSWAPLLKKGTQLVGIPHGVDKMQWNPKTDPFLRSKFDVNQKQNKIRIHEQLQRAAGLKVQGNSIVASFIGPLTKANGCEILAAAIPDLVKEGIQVLVATDVPTGLSKTFEALVKKYPGMVSIKHAIDEEFLHNCIAGSTLLLKPSVHEASGQFQRCALLYGTVPVVRKTGGLAHGMTDVDASAEPSGNAILFEKATAAALTEAVLKAASLYANPNTWDIIVTHAMNTDVRWTLSALPYDEFYRNLVKDTK